jgi:ribose transport system substrate-binding protein
MWERVARVACSVLCVGALVFALSGCQKAAEPVASAGAGPAKSAPTKAGEKYYCIGISTGGDYWNAVKAGMKDAAGELGVEQDFQGPSTHDPAMQSDTMEQLIAQKPAGILIAPGSPDVLTPVIDRAMAQGVPVICIDTDAPKSKRIAYFGTENYNAGRKGAEILARLVGGKGQVAISTRPGQWNLDERVRGYKEYFAENCPGIVFGPTIDDETKQEVGETKAASVLTSYPDLAGFAGVNGASGLGIASAIRAQGKVGKIKVVAMDGDAGILDLIQQGLIDASIAQRQYWMSYIGLLYLYGLNHGFFAKPGEGAKLDLPEIPAVIDTTVVEANKDNLDAFRSPSQGAKESVPDQYRKAMEVLKAGKPMKAAEFEALVGPVPPAKTESAAKG